MLYEVITLPVSFHIGTGSFDSGFSPARIENLGIGSTNAITAVSLFLDNGKQLVDLLFSGILPLHPKLKVISVESGIGFIPFVLEACDYAFHYSRIRDQRPEFELLPSEYFARQVYSCFWFEDRITSYNVCYTKLLRSSSRERRSHRLFGAENHPGHRCRIRAAPT